MDAFLKILVARDGGWLFLVVVRDPVSCAQFATRGIAMKGPRRDLLVAERSLQES